MGAGSISDTDGIGGDEPLPTVSLHFGSGNRPNMKAVVAFAREHAGFSVALQPQVEATALPHWMELLVDGLAFDLVGLFPGPPAATPLPVHGYGLPEGFSITRLEAVTLQVGPHLAGGARMRPAVQSLAWLAAHLSSLPDVEAVAWHPARCVSAPEAFRESVLPWLEGGAFPLRSLIALVPMPDGGLQSDGLALVCGQDLRIEPELVVDRAAGEDAARAVLAWMMEHGPLEQSTRNVAVESLRLRLEPSANGRFVRAWKE